MTARIGSREAGKREAARRADLTKALLDLTKDYIAKGMTAVDAWNAIYDAEAEVYQWGCREEEEKTP